MEDIINFLNMQSIYFQKLSDNMLSFGFNDKYICGTISFYTPTPLCRMFYFNGKAKYFKDFYFNESEFENEYHKASSGYVYLRSKEVDNILNVLD